MSSTSSLLESTGLKADYEAVLVEPWSPYVGAILLLVAVFALDKLALLAQIDEALARPITAFRLPTERLVGLGL